MWFLPLKKIFGFFVGLTFGLDHEFCFCKGGYDEEVRDIKIDNLVKLFPEYLKPNWIY